MAIRRKYFKRDCPIEAALFQCAYRCMQIEVSCAQGQMKIGVPALVVMEMHVAKPTAVSFQDFLSRVAWDHQVRMTDIKMQSEFRHCVKQFPKLPSRR